MHYEKDCYARETLKSVNSYSVRKRPILIPQLTQRSTFYNATTARREFSGGVVPWTCV